MPYSPSKNQGRQARHIFYLSILSTLIGLIVGPLMILRGIHNNNRDRPSLQWPKVSGKLMRCDEVWHPGGGRHSSGTWGIAATYTYVVNNHRHTQGQITLWNPDLNGNTGNFKSTHPVPSPVDVYYDPQNPGNAVLIPGADEAGNRVSIILGSVLFGMGILMTLMLRPAYARYKAQKSPGHSKAHTATPARPTGLPHAFASYEPASTRKLNVFPDKDAVLQILGQDDDKPLQKWQPEDRMIDATGREYRMRKDQDKKYYDLEPTGETWSCERLLNLADADYRLMKKDPEVLRHQLDGVPESDRMAVLMKCIDKLPAGPIWFIPALILFLLLFFLAVTFGVGKVYIWLSDHWQK